MPLFEYKGLKASGAYVKGSLEGESLKSVKLELKRQGIFLQEIKARIHEKNKVPLLKSKKVKTADLAIFTRLLASLLRAGIPLVEALDSISQQIPHPRLRGAVSRLKDQVNEGQPFHLALKEYPMIFDVIYVSLCEAGEAGGSLHDILERIAGLMEKRSAIRNKVLTAMFYPMILLVIAVAVMLILCIKVIPQLMEMFEDQQSALPWMTQFTFGLSRFLIDYWVVLGVFFLIGAWVFRRWKKSRTGRKIWDGLILKTPVFGPLARAADIALFSQTLSALLKGGVPVLKSMDIVKNVLKNSWLQDAVQNARENIKEGEAVVEPLERSGQFPPVVLQMIRTGEKTGELENMLEQISKTYDRQLEVEVSALTALLGPVMILVMALIIAFILMSALLPMLESFDALT